jgi:hypothetical protein
MIGGHSHPSTGCGVTTARLRDERHLQGDDEPLPSDLTHPRPVAGAVEPPEVRQCPRITSARSARTMRQDGVVPIGQETTRLEVHPRLSAGNTFPPLGYSCVSRTARQWKPIADRVRRMYQQPTTGGSRAARASPHAALAAKIQCKTNSGIGGDSRMGKCALSGPASCLPAPPARMRLPRGGRGRMPRERNGRIARQGPSGWRGPAGCLRSRLRAVSAA